jgi:hypothetical protein
LVQAIVAIKKDNGHGHCCGWWVVGGGTCSQVGIWQYQSCFVSGTGYLVSGCVW